MQWLADLAARFGSQGASSNVSRSITEEREAAAQLDRFLVRLAHPAGQALLPLEPAAGECSRVA